MAKGPEGGSFYDASDSEREKDELLLNILRAIKECLAEHSINNKSLKPEEREKLTGRKYGDPDLTQEELEAWHEHNKGKLRPQWSANLFGSLETLATLVAPSSLQFQMDIEKQTKPFYKQVEKKRHAPRGLTVHNIIKMEDKAFDILEQIRSSSEISERHSGMLAEFIAELRSGNSSESSEVAS